MPTQPPPNTNIANISKSVGNRTDIVYFLYSGNAYPVKDPKFVWGLSTVVKPIIVDGTLIPILSEDQFVRLFKLEALLLDRL